MEYFDIVDRQGNPTGKTVERAYAHRYGVPHRTGHVWIFRRKEGKLQVLLQKRCMTKDSFPGCYDISSAGHVPAGMDVQTSALRELKEELGQTVSPEELKDCGNFCLHVENEFHGIPYVDEQVARVYILWLDKDEAGFTVQEEEIESIRWFDFEECKTAVREHAIPNCIELDELAILERNLDQEKEPA